MVSLYVGAEKRKFHVHKKLLCSKIPAFQAMFCGSFKEAEEGIAYLPEDSPVAIELLVEWLYRGFLTPVVIEEGADRASTRGAARDAATRWTQLFSLAEKYCIETCMDQSLELIKNTHKKYHMYYNCQAMANGYNNTHEGSRLRLYILRSLCYITLEKDTSDAWPTADIQQLLRETPDLSDDLIKEIRGRRRKGSCLKPHEFPACDYHQHNLITPCPYSTRNIEVMVADPNGHQSKKRKITTESPKAEPTIEIE